MSWASRPAKPRPPPPPEPLPSDGWDPLWLPSRKRLALSLFPAWVRPAWWPDWADPFDASSDLRRWIFPYLVAPYVCVQVLKWTLIAPVFAAELATSPGGGSGAFALRPEQTEKCEAEAERYRAHLSFEQLMQRAPPLAEADLLAAVRAKLAADEAACAEENCRASTELAADATFTTAGVANVFLNRRSVQTVQISVSKEFFALDSSKQAFLLLLVSDILVGYHSSEGWATALQLVANHYGLQESKDLTALFIAVVPVSLDVLFKFWRALPAPPLAARSCAAHALRTAGALRSCGSCRRTRRSSSARLTAEDRARENCTQKSYLAAPPRRVAPARHASAARRSPAVYLALSWSNDFRGGTAQNIFRTTINRAPSTPGRSPLNARPRAVLRLVAHALAVVRPPPRPAGAPLRSLLLQGHRRRGQVRRRQVRRARGAAEGRRRRRLVGACARAAALVVGNGACVRLAGHGPLHNHVQPL